jgi:hypothetical protein
MQFFQEMQRTLFIIPIVAREATQAIEYEGATILAFVMSFRFPFVSALIYLLKTGFYNFKGATRMITIF